jgi:Trk K+ transport system NAD-binding subunit
MVKFSALMLSWISGPLRERNLRPFFFLLILFVTLIGLYSAIFHVLMDAEGQSYSWATAVYWTIVTMSTLGYGDVVFTSGIGQLFSVVVLLSGSALILVLLPFTFIQFVFMPWMDRRAQRATPRKLPVELHDHMILTGLGPIEYALVARAQRAGVPYAILVSSPNEAVEASSLGFKVMIGELDDPATYVAARASQAAVVVTTRTDPANANIAFTARGATTAPIVATANSPASVDVLELAGASRVLELGPMLGEAMARRVLSPEGTAHVVGQRDDLLIAEVGAARSPLAGKSLAETEVRARTGATVLGSWMRGGFEPARASTVVDPAATLVLAGTSDHIERFNNTFVSPDCDGETSSYVMILGAGRVGKSLAHQLTLAGVPHTMVERNPDREHDPSEQFVVGDAADLAVLRTAGIDRATTVAITTHDDDMNVYLALYIRKLRPNVELLCRSNLDRNVVTLYRAGADSVLSYAAAGADAVWREFRGNETVLLAEGLEVFTMAVPTDLEGMTLSQADLPARTRCSVVAVVDAAGITTANPGADHLLPSGGSLLLIGGHEAEQAARSLSLQSRARSRRS